MSYDRTYKQTETQTEIPLGSLKKIQPIRSSRLGGYRKHIYEEIQNRRLKLTSGSLYYIRFMSSLQTYPLWVTL